MSRHAEKQEAARRIMASQARKTALADRFRQRTVDRALANVLKRVCDEKTAKVSSNPGIAQTDSGAKADESGVQTGEGEAEMKPTHQQVRYRCLRRQSELFGRVVVISEDYTGDWVTVCPVSAPYSEAMVKRDQLRVIKD